MPLIGMSSPSCGDHEPSSQSGSVGLTSLGPMKVRKDLLHAQAQAPGGQQRVQRPLVEVADQRPLGQPADGKGQHEGEQDGERKVIGDEAGQRSFDDQVDTR